MQNKMKVCMTIGGSDCSGGAGIQADLKTFSNFRIYGTSVITAITSQNTYEIKDIFPLPPKIVASQLEAVINDFPVIATKISMLYSKENIQIVSSIIDRAKFSYIILDPIIKSSLGKLLLDEDAIDILINNLLPLTTLVTPNIPEAEIITKMKIDGIDDVKKSAKIMYDRYGCKVLLKGGHSSDEFKSEDIFFDGENYFSFVKDRIYTKNTHGTGCTLSAAITSLLALGLDMYDAISKAKEYITGAIINAPCLGKGNGPLNHFWTQFNNLRD